MKSALVNMNLVGWKLPDVHRDTWSIFIGPHLTFSEGDKRVHHIVGNDLKVDQFGTRINYPIRHPLSSSVLTFFPLVSVVILLNLVSSLCPPTPELSHHQPSSPSSTPRQSPSSPSSADSSPSSVDLVGRFAILAISSEKKDTWHIKMHLQCKAMECTNTQITLSEGVAYTQSNWIDIDLRTSNFSQNLLTRVLAQAHE